MSSINNEKKRTSNASETMSDLRKSNAYMFAEDFDNYQSEVSVSDIMDFKPSHNAPKASVQRENLHHQKSWSTIKLRHDIVQLWRDTIEPTPAVPPISPLLQMQNQLGLPPHHSDEASSAYSIHSDLKEQKDIPNSVALQVNNTNAYYKSSKSSAMASAQGSSTTAITIQETESSKVGGEDPVKKFFVWGFIFFPVWFIGGYSKQTLDTSKKSVWRNRCRVASWCFMAFLVVLIFLLAFFLPSILED